MQIPTDNIVLSLVIMTIIFLVGSCFLLLYMLLYNKRRQQHRLEKEIMQRNFDEELIKTKIEVQEQTMQTIASDIHDNIGQILGLTKLTLSSVDLQTGLSKAQNKIDASMELLTSSIKELRHLAAILHAQNLLDSGIEQAVQKELAWINRTGKLAGTLHSFGLVTSQLDAEKELMIFRLIQELMNNVIKHAEAKRMEVKFSYHLAVMEIQVIDDGKGFDVKAAMARPTGLGMATLQKRAALIGGDLTIVSKESSGTIATLLIHINSNHNGE